MTKKSVTLLVAAILLAATYVYYFTDWINPPIIQIIAQVRPYTIAARAGASFGTVIFTLDRKYALTTVKVVPVSALATNRNPAPLWYLVKNTNSVPVHGFAYGARLRGLRPAVPQARPEPLEPGTQYRLFVASGRAKGQIDFRTAGPPANN
jgi:hypothetical protein